MAESVQDMEVATNNSTVDKQTNKFKSTLDDLITSQGKGPYFCPDCGKGTGYSIYAFKAHVANNQGLCKSINAGRKFYRCVHCKIDCSRPSDLKRHNSKFGDKCKGRYLSHRDKGIMDNFSKNFIIILILLRNGFVGRVSVVGLGSFFCVQGGSF